MGRIIGDGVYYYLQDIIILPNYKQQGIGRKVLQELEEWLKNTTHPNTFIGLMVAEDTVNFYKKFNYKARDFNKPGMFKIKA